ncbi:MAG: hypothetical protein GTO63_15655 [Anaerolineae bacterium]|nr:hypothetical protein [Anaerolineae bacterium]NIN96265.1 hypothetical protein [Anaerolineae bacterium]NIQ79285.1 hypothetical protein [Anaerolineae bacterium]
MPIGHEWNADYIPMDFSITMPHHLSQTDPKGGAYPREGKSYKRLWVHAIQYGGKTRYWEGSDNPPSYQLGASTAYVIPVPGEELNKASVGEVEITMSLMNPLAPQYQYDNETQPWGDQTDAATFGVGVHAVPANERKLTGRGLTIAFYCQDVASKIRFNGWGGEFGAGPQNFYWEYPTYPYPNTP